MTSLRAWRCDDMFKFANVNLDQWTETYNISFYLQYLLRWPEYFTTAESSSGSIMGYVMGKAEGTNELWHGHVTAVTVAPEFRRVGVAATLMHELEHVSEKTHNNYFVDLFVRVSNHLAIEMYTGFGYVVYRRVLGYYSGEEDAFDMRKALPRDVDKTSVIPLKHPVHPDELQFD